MPVVAWSLWPQKWIRENAAHLAAAGRPAVSAGRRWRWWVMRVPSLHSMVRGRCRYRLPAYIVALLSLYTCLNTVFCHLRWRSFLQHGIFGLMSAHKQSESSYCLSQICRRCRRAVETTDHNWNMWSCHFDPASPLSLDCRRVAYTWLQSNLDILNLDKMYTTFFYGTGNWKY